MVLAHSRALKTTGNTAVIEADLRDPAAILNHPRKTVASGSMLRDRDEILRFFTGFELADPGLIQVPRWRPDEHEPPDAGKVWVLGAVGRKPPEAGA